MLGFENSPPHLIIYPVPGVRLVGDQRKRRDNVYFSFFYIFVLAIFRAARDLSNAWNRLSSRWQVDFPAEMVGMLVVWLRYAKPP